VKKSNIIFVVNLEKGTIDDKIGAAYKALSFMLFSLGMYA